MNRMTIGVAALLMLAWGNFVAAAVVTIQPGPTEGKDTWIWLTEDFSHGNWGELRANQTSVYDQRVLIQFDLSAIPSGAIVNSASLGLYRYDSFDTSLTLDAHGITSAWSEDVTYSTQPGFDATVVSSTFISGTDARWFTWDVTSLAQGWVSAPSNNFGVAIYDHGTGFFERFVSSDNVEATQPWFELPPRDPALRPYLQVDYTTSAIPEPSTLVIWLCLGTLGAAMGWWRRRLG